MSYEDLVDNLAGKFLAAARGHQLGVVLSAFGCAARQIADSIGADLEEALETILEEERAVEYEEDRVCNERTRLHADDPPLWAEPVLGLPTKPRDDSSLRPEEPGRVKLTFMDGNLPAGLEAMLHDLGDRLLWLEARHGVPMSQVDRLIAEEMAKRRRRLGSCGLDALDCGPLSPLK